VAGAIHLYLTSSGDDEFLDDPNTKLSIESGFQRLIRFGMQEGLYISDDTAKYVSFIGTRIYAGDEAPPSNNLEGGPASNGEPTLPKKESNRAAIIIGVVGAFIVVFLSWFLLISRGKRNAIAADNGNVGHQLGNNIAFSNLTAGVVNEENSQLTVKPIVKAPRVLPSMVTAGTMATSVEEDGFEPADSLTQKSKQGQSFMSSSDNETYTTGDLKIFQDDEDDEEEENKIFYLPSSKMRKGRPMNLSSGASQHKAPRTIADTDADESTESLTEKPNTPH
jgi:hypothetical protein